MMRDLLDPLTWQKKLAVSGLLGMNVLKCCYQELFCQHEESLFSSLTVKQAGKEWKQALLECQSLAFSAESGLLGKAVVRAGSAIRVPVSSSQWVPTIGCQDMSRVITSVFLEPPIGEEGALPANILI